MPHERRYIPAAVVAEWARRLDALLGDVRGRVYVSDLHRVLELPDVARSAVVAAMRRLGWVGPVRVSSDRTRTAYLRGTLIESYKVIYIHCDPVTGAISVSHTPP